MRRPTGCALAWFVAFAGVTTLLLRMMFAADSAPDIMFPKKSFIWFSEPKPYANVYVIGTLTGEGVMYKNNTTVVSCDNSRMECVTFTVDQIGPNQGKNMLDSSA